MPTLRTNLEDYIVLLNARLRDLKRHIDHNEKCNYELNYIIKTKKELLELLDVSDRGQPARTDDAFRDAIALKFLEGATNKISLAAGQLNALCRNAYAYADMVIAARDGKPQGESDATS